MEHEKECCMMARLDERQKAAEMARGLALECLDERRKADLARHQSSMNLILAIMGFLVAIGVGIWRK